MKDQKAAAQLEELLLKLSQTDLELEKNGDGNGETAGIVLDSEDLFKIISCIFVTLRSFKEELKKELDSDKRRELLHDGFELSELLFRLIEAAEQLEAQP